MAAEEKAISQMKKFADEFKRRPALLVVEYREHTFRVFDPWTKITTEYSREGFADLLMSYRDNHIKECPFSDLEPQKTWAQEKIENGGSPWRT